MRMPQLKKALSNVSISMLQLKKSTKQCLPARKGMRMLQLKKWRPVLACAFEDTQERKEIHAMHASCTYHFESANTVANLLHIKVETLLRYT